MPQIGWFEILIIVVLSILIVGPKDFPIMLRKIGNWIGSVKKYFSEVQRNISEVESDIDAARKAIAALLPHARIDVKGIGDSLVLTGTVRSSRESVDATNVARRFVKEDNNVINMLRILKDLQVLLQVRVAEMARATIKNLGTSTSFLRLLRNRAHSLTTTSIFPASTAAAATGTITFNKLGLQTTTFEALERQGLIKTLAEPALTAISGETANFLAGGELPTPSGIDSQGNVIVDFREFGVALSFTPVVLDKNQISLRISTEVSRQADENKLVLPFGTNNQTVDVVGLSIRRAESTVNLASGASMMIAGLLQRDEVNQIDGVPWLKDLPVIGALFRSQAFEKNETELVVLVTPYIVRPLEPVSKLNLPTDGFISASDMDIYLLGRLYKKYGHSSATMEEIPIIQGPVGYIMK